MHVDLISTTKGSPKVVHATENSKKTACGINLTKPESIGQFASAGELSDVIQITCEKCKTIIAKKLIKESNREMAAQLKEEQKRLKRERSASRHQHGGAAEVSPAPQDNAKSATSGGYIPPSMRKTIREQQNQAPIETPTPAVDPTPMPRTSPAAAAHDDALSQFAIPTVPTSVPGAIPIAPPSAPASAPTPTPASAEADDVLAQFAIPTVPTSVPGAIPIAAPAPAPAPTPAPAEADDVFAQFAIPTVPTSVPGAIPIAAPAPAPAPTPAPAVDDDVLAQFAIPTVPTSVPGAIPIAAPAPAPAPAPAADDDVLAQFAIPTVPTSAPGVIPIAPAPADADDVLAQFAIPTVPTSAPHSAPQFDAPTIPVTLPPVSAQNDDVLSQFSIPTVPTDLPNNAPKRAPAADPDDLLAKFSAPTDIPPLDTPPAIGDAAVTDDILAQFSANPPAAAPQLSPMEALGIDAMPIEAEIDETLSAVANTLFENEILDVTPVPVPEPVGLDSLDDLLLMPGKTQPEPAASTTPVMPEPLPDIATVPTSAPAAQYPEITPMAVPQQPAPTLNVPPVPQMTVPQQPAPTLNVPPVPQMTVPQQPAPTLNVPPVPQSTMPQQPAPTLNVPPIPQMTVPQQPVPTLNVPPVPQMTVPQQPAYQPQHNSLYSVPSAPQPQDSAQTPLFVGYSADGRQIFQKYDAIGNPIPINEPVYSSPPEQPSHQVRTQAQMFNAGAAAPVMDMDELMASMGIEDPSKRKMDEGKAINFTEYKIPPKKAKKSAVKKVEAPKPEETGPISAAEAKRRKKVDKINKEFEKQLRSRGIDPKTGGLIIDPKK